MMSKEGAIRKFVEQYEIEVPQQLVEEEYKMCVMDMKHKMVYGQMAGSTHMDPLEQARAMEEAREELKAVAYQTVKEELVMKDVLAKGDFPVTAEELEKHAEDMAKRQHSSMEMIKKFFGEDLSLLEGDVRRRKAEAWIYEQVTAGL